MPGDGIGETMKSRIVLGGRDAAAVAAVRRQLEPDFDVVGVASEGASLLALAVWLRPEVIVLDAEMPGLSAIVAARRLRERFPVVKLVLLGERADARAEREALRAGAFAYVPRHGAGGELARAMRAALEGRRRMTKAADVELPQRAPAGWLTPRQCRVLELIAAGYANKEIAHRLRISVKTVEFHKTNIMARLGLRTTAALTKYAVRHGLAEM